LSSKALSSVETILRTAAPFTGNRHKMYTGIHLFAGAKAAYW